MPTSPPPTNSFVQAFQPPKRAQLLTEKGSPPPLILLHIDKANHIPPPQPHTLTP
jgi:hypothetical protein